MDSNTKQELNELSKRAFGASSRWRKLVDNGIKQPVEKDREVMVPAANGRLVKKTFTDRKIVIKRFSVDEVRTLMLGILNRDNALQHPAKDSIVTVVPGADVRPGMTIEAADGSIVGTVQGPITY